MRMRSSINLALSLIISLGVVPALAQSAPPGPVTLPDGAAQSPPGELVVVQPVKLMKEYARAGTLEIGGAGSLSGSRGFTTAGVTGNIGVFVVDGLELSLLTNVTYTRASTIRPKDLLLGVDSLGDDKATALGYAVFEPSYHLRASARAFPFIGVGVGVAYAKPDGVDGKVGVAIAPRLGVNVVAGRSGVFTPSINLLYTTADTIRVSDNETVKVNTTYGLTAGFSVFL